MEIRNHFEFSHFMSDLDLGSQKLLQKWIPWVQKHQKSGIALIFVIVIKKIGFYPWAMVAMLGKALF